MNKLQLALARNNTATPPVWFMRQAGRYHAHYQNLRRAHSFMDLCKIPELACKVTLGPIEDFDFDSAILFSDLLFPLEVLGMGLSYPEGPQLDWHLKTKEDLNRLGFQSNDGLQFQAEALKLIRRKLPPQKGLLGFVGGPLTLFFYAAAGSHKGDLKSAHEGLIDGRYFGFCSIILDLLARNMALQARAGADAVAIFDTCAGELTPELFKEFVIPALKNLLLKFKDLCPLTPVIYYSKGTGASHLRLLKNLQFQCLGVDWNNNLCEILNEFGEDYSIQGNIDPHWLFLDAHELDKRLRDTFLEVKNLPLQKRQGWVCGLGHGVLPKTPEDHVRLFIKTFREIFSS